MRRINIISIELIALCVCLDNYYYKGTGCLDWHKAPKNCDSQHFVHTCTKFIVFVILGIWIPCILLTSKRIIQKLFKSCYDTSCLCFCRRSREQVQIWWQFTSPWEMGSWSKNISQQKQRTSRLVCVHFY